MASFALSVGLPKLLHAGPLIARRTPLGMRVLVTAVPPNPFETDTKMPKDASAGDHQSSAQDRGVATATKAVEEAQNLGEKAKQTVQDAWGTAKDTAQKVKETVVGKAEDATACVKENVNNAKKSVKEKALDAEVSVKENRDTIKKSMNTKNC